MTPLPLFYFGNLYFFKTIKHIGDISDYIMFDVHEHFIKQSYRSRTVILGAQGPLNLIIPVHKKNHSPMMDVTINYDQSWEKQHLQSIKSAYSGAAYFLDYFPSIKTLLEQKPKFLVDLNQATIEVILKHLNYNPILKKSNSFVPYGSNDLRLTNSPKVKQSGSFQSYFQVFDEKHGFIPNLSILDLLFNEGPSAELYL